MDANRQCLTDPAVQPTAAEIADALGGANQAFSVFACGLGAMEISLMEWRYYNDGKAWPSKGEYKWTTPRGAKKVKPIFWLSIWEGFFRISFFFAFEQRADLLNLSISNAAKDAIKNRKPMGKTMRFLPVVLDIANEVQLDDIYTLAQFKK